MHLLQKWKISNRYWLWLYFLFLLLAAPTLSFFLAVCHSCRRLVNVVPLFSDSKITQCSYCFNGVFCSISIYIETHHTNELIMMMRFDYYVQFSFGRFEKWTKWTEVTIKINIDFALHTHKHLHLFACECCHTTKMKTMKLELRSEETKR